MSSAEFHSSFSEEGRVPGSVVKKTLMGASVDVRAPFSTASPVFTGTVTGDRFLSTLTGDVGITHGFGTTLGVGSDNVGGGNLAFYSSSAVQWRINGATGDLTSPAGRNLSTTGDVDPGAAGGYQVNTVVMRNTAPTISAAGTSPSVLVSNGTAAFRIDVGTGGTANGFTMTFPAAANRWLCSCRNVTTFTTLTEIVQTGDSTTTCVMQQRTRSTNAALVFVASDDVDCTAVGQ
jgi:hypothetical protein